MTNIKLFLCNLFQECCYILWDGKDEGVIVDPGFDSEEEKRKVFDFIRQESIVIRGILLTHAHFDHIYGVEECVKAFGVRVYMNPEDKIIISKNHLLAERFGMRVPDTGFVTEDLADGDVLKFGEMEFEVITTPGHTPGGVCFFEKNGRILLSGDTLFAGSIGRTDSPWGDYDKLIVSIMDKLMGLDGDIEILPGHGPKSSIGFERTRNPFLQPFNNPDDFEFENSSDEI